MSKKRVFIILGAFFVVSLLTIALASYKMNAQEWDVTEKMREDDRERDEEQLAERPIEIAQDIDSKENLRARV